VARPWFSTSKQEHGALAFVIIGVRMLLLTVWFFLSCIIGCVLCIFKWRSPDLPQLVCSFYSPVSAWLAGMRLVQRDWHHTKVADDAAIYVANHQTFLDLSFFGQNMPNRVVCTAKRELAWVPFFGLFWYASGNIFIDRQRRDSAVKSLDAGTDRLKRKECSIFVFSEGTRNHANPLKLLPFKKGFAHMAVQSGRPIVPIVASVHETLVDPAKGLWRGGVVVVKALPPIDVTGKTTADVDEIVKSTYDLMQKALDEVNAEARQLNSL